jgi:hypothetical protein
MFWRRFEQDLADRLRVALEFATLGAYELLGQEQAADRAPEPPPVEGSEPSPRCASVAGETRGHVGRSNVPCARVDGKLVEPPCPQIDEPAGVVSHSRPRRPDRRHRRGGSAPPSQQPCTWAGR